MIEQDTGGGVVLYIKGLSVNTRETFSTDIENIFVDICLTKTKQS